MKKILKRFTNIRLKQDRKMHFQNDNTTSCVKNCKIQKNFVADGKFLMYSSIKR